ncbi:NAD(P)/FAD-dependent oxidoreductase [Alteromonas facilis]|uniref:NAD(P)/FAD-dependent oxidoreductase n=1 Tax=Alteromonas facilis TaxID=2048004 RepID=UPI000C290896|nr:FAD-dependent oxidoreductase [Alteromonas facilis]
MYDPLVNSLPPSEYVKPDSFWADGFEPSHFPQLEGNVDTDVAIIGGGYTGLSAAYHLANQYGVKCCIVEANQPGWGCSGRNGGFVLPGSGRLGVEQLRKRFGQAMSQTLYAEYLSSIDSVDQLIEAGIECDKVQGGYLKVAHSEGAMQQLQALAGMLSQQYNNDIEVVNADEVREQYLAGTSSHGGIYFPSAFAINPWRLCKGLAGLAEKAGANIYGHSPVNNVISEAKQHRLITAKGEVRAKHLIVASNAYGQRKLIPQLKDRLFPVLSSILVTPPLTDAQIAAIGMSKGLMVMDTRPMKYYYRLLPDNRLLFGGRGAVYGKDANEQVYKEGLLKGLQDTFPALRDVSIDKFWSGWVDISFDDFPRIYHQQQSRILYSAGYCGSGLAFSIHAGKRLTQLLMAPETLSSLPFWQTPLKRFPFAFARRPALQFYYWWQQHK